MKFVIRFFNRDNQLTYWWHHRPNGYKGWTNKFDEATWYNAADLEAKINSINEFDRKAIAVIPACSEQFARL